MFKIDRRILLGEYPDFLPKAKSNKGVGLTDKEFKLCNIVFDIYTGKRKSISDKQALVEAGYSPKTAIQPFEKRSCGVYLSGLFKRFLEKNEEQKKRIQKKLLDEAEKSIDRLADMAENAKNEHVRLKANLALIENSDIKDPEPQPLQIQQNYEQNITIWKQERRTENDEQQPVFTIPTTAAV